MQEFGVQYKTETPHLVVDSSIVGPAVQKSLDTFLHTAGHNGWFRLIVHI